MIESEHKNKSLRGFFPCCFGLFESDCDRKKCYNKFVFNIRLQNDDFFFSFSRISLLGLVLILSPSGFSLFWEE